ncbi:MAG: type II toxin-antitoxin system VapC family toxin, partial [Rhodothermales bacterium]
MRPALYIETSVVSYLTARPSRDLVTAARQQLTEAWWQARRSSYDLLISPLVLEAADAGDARAAEARLGALEGIPLIEPAPEADALAERLLRDVPLPEKAAADAAHIAVATAAGVDYLLTWNFKH